MATGVAVGSDPPEAVLSLRDVDFRRGGRLVLRGVGLDVYGGERLALIGPSGAGKTTLLRLAAGLERPDAGRVSPEVLPGRRHGGGIPVGLLFQDLGLFPHLRVRTNVAFPLLARGMGRRERRERADRALEQAGLAGYADRFPGSLSGGERQRVAIVRTLLSAPAIVLLDEPFAALDPHLLDHFLTWLEELRSRTGVTMVLVTHDVPLAMRWADRIAVLADGQLVQVGAPAELYARPETEFVATFLGRANVLDAVLTEVRPDTVVCRVPALGDRPVRATGGGTGSVPQARCRLLVRPHDLTLTTDGADDPAGVPATVRGAEFAGQHDDLLLTTDTGTALRVSIPVATTRPRPGERVGVRWPPTAAHVVLS